MKPFAMNDLEKFTKALYLITHLKSWGLNLQSKRAVIFSFIFLTVTLFGNGLHAQKGTVTYTNNLHSYEGIPNLSEAGFYKHWIDYITLKPDSTFEFWSRPLVSCFTWHQYKGNSKKMKDTLYFYDNAEIVERDFRATYKKMNTNKFHIEFSTNKKSVLKNKEMKIQYIYDFNANLKDYEKIVFLNDDSFIEIPFIEIPNYDKLAAIKVDYLLNFKDNRYVYLTENEMLNIKKVDLSNNIKVEIIENPKKETVYRITKGIIQNNAMVIKSSIKSKTTLPDYTGELKFENSYAIAK